MQKILIQILVQDIKKIMDGVNVCLETYLPEQPAIFPEEVSARPHQAELPRGDCFADSTPLGFNALLQGAAHLGRLTGFACKSFSIVSPRGQQLKALCRQHLVGERLTQVVLNLQSSHREVALEILYLDA